MKAALLVIDMQNDFVKENSILEVKGAVKNIPKLKSFIDACRNKGIMVIYTRHIYDPKNNPIEAKLFPELAKEGLRENSKGSEIYHGIKPEKNDIVIKKHRYDAFFNTNLGRILNEKGIIDVIITGLMTNICCESTARTAMMKDFNVLFCSDLTFANDKEIHENTLKNIKSHFGRVLTSDKIIEEI